MTERRHQVVVVGGGFGGLNATRALAKADVDVTLLDRTNHHLFQPLLYQVAAGILPEGLVAPALRSVIKKQRNARALLAEADGDLDGAARLHDQAADGWQAYGHRAEQAQALLGAGRCLRRLGRPEAAARLREARAGFRRLGAGPLVQEAGTWLLGGAASGY